MKRLPLILVLFLVLFCFQYLHNKYFLPEYSLREDFKMSPTERMEMRHRIMDNKKDFIFQLIDSSGGLNSVMGIKLYNNDSVKAKLGGYFEADKEWNEISLEATTNFVGGINTSSNNAFSWIKNLFGYEIENEDKSFERVEELDKLNEETKDLNILAWPLLIRPSKITSKYGFRYHPVYKTKRMHKGIDILAPENANVVAPSNGFVYLTGFNNSMGKYLFIKNNKGLVFVFCHLNRILVSKNELVERNQKIGQVGSTGIVTGPHLHFEIHKNGESKNPLTFDFLK